METFNEVAGCTNVVTTVYTATDDCDNTSTVTRVVTIVDTTAPVASNAPENQSIACADFTGVMNIAAPAFTDVCDNDGAALTVRADDREEVVLQRLQTYQTQTWPVAETLRKNGILVEAIECGEMDPESVADRIRWRLDRIGGSIAKKNKPE
jgi:adenylate kinase family enzyme